MNTTIKVRIPPIVDIKIAITLYYLRTALSNADIELLFGKHSSSTVAKLKKMAQDKMEEMHIMSWNDICVNTVAAYEAWGLDIHDLEHRYEKLKQFGQLA